VGVTVDVVEQATGLTVATEITDEQGDYAIGGIPQGTYVVRFTSASTGPRWYVNANAAGDATPVVLLPGAELRNIDVQLSVERSLAGTVTDHRNPVPGATVVAFTLTGSSAGSATTG